MDHHHQHSLYNLNAIKTLKAEQNQDANAIAIDSMLLHLKTLIKKYLLMKKLAKDLNQAQSDINQDQVNSKIAIINQQSKNITLVFDKIIPPDKRMTNLFYMRILKEISYFEKVIPAFSQIIHVIQTIYTEQVRSDNFSILAIYVVCQKKLVQEIKANKFKILHVLEEKKMKFIVEKIHLQHSLIDKKNDYFSQKNFEFENYTRHTLSDLNTNIINTLLDIFVEKKTQQKKVIHSLDQIIHKGSLSIVLSDYRQRVTPVIDNIYSPLDLAGIEIVTLFIPTLRPEDNIELIYRKVSSRNKKSRKQIKQFQAEFSLYLFKKQEYIKRKVRKTQIRQSKIQSSIIQWSQKMSKSHLNEQNTLQNSKKQQTKKYFFKTIDLLKPIKQNQKQRSLSRFRQRIQQSIQNSKSISTTISHFRPNNLAPIISSHNQGVLQIKLKRKRASQILSQDKKDKQNDEDNSAKLLKKQKQSKSKKFQIKNVKNQKRGRSLKNASNKDFASKKLRL